RYRTAVEVAAPVTVMTEPEASASRVQAGAAIPVGPQRHVALLGTRYAATPTTRPPAPTSPPPPTSPVENRARLSWPAGTRLHDAATRGGTRGEVGAGGAMAAAVPVGRRLEIEGDAELETPWDEAAVALLHGGRTSSVAGHGYAHDLSRHLLLQVGARRRRLSILPRESGSGRRPEAWQSLWLAGADVVLWSASPTLRGEMLD